METELLKSVLVATPKKAPKKAKEAEKTKEEIREVPAGTPGS
jgi:hypothetical protein